MAPLQKPASGTIHLLYLIVVIGWLSFVASEEWVRAQCRGTTHHFRTFIFFALKRWIVYPWRQINKIDISVPSSGHLPRGTSRLLAVCYCVFLKSNTFHPGPSNFHLQISALMTPFREPHHKCDESTTKKDTAVCCCILVDCCVELDRLDCTHVTRFGHTSCTVPRLTVPPFFHVRGWFWSL